MTTLDKRILKLERLIQSVGGSSRWGPKPEYRENILGYCQDVLKVQLTPQQERVCQAVQEHRQVLVPSGNEVGKSFLGACLASWHYDCFDPGYTIITGPVYEQLKDTVFAELRVLRQGDKNFAPAEMRLQGLNSPKHWCKGYTARSDTAFQGRHEGSVFVLIEEAEDVAPEFWVAADSLSHYQVAIYNPISSSAETVGRERSGQYFIVRLSALDHPNIDAGLSGQPAPFPKAITLPRLIDRLEKWCKPVLPADRQEGDIELAGKIYRPGPIAEARILGKRSTFSTGSVFSLGLMESVLQTRRVIDPLWPKAIGVDVARFGDDFTAIHARHGVCSLFHESHNGLRETEVARRLIDLALKMADGDEPAAKRIPINIDDAPVGNGVQDILTEAGFRVIPVNSASSATKPGFPNIRSQLWFDGREVAEAGLMDLSRLTKETTDALHQQLTAPEYSFNSKGQRVVDEKKVTKRKIGRSPDDADALLLCYYIAPPFKERQS